MRDLHDLSLRSIFYFWLPLAVTWFIMATEMPFIGAVVARLPAPSQNLAAFGLAFSILIFIESPVFMLLAGATALVDSKENYRRLRDFTLLLGTVLTLFLTIVAYPEPYTFIAKHVMEIPRDLWRLVRNTLIIFMPIPLAVGYRRFCQGILIRYRLTGRVALGTGIRISVVTLLAIGLFYGTELEGAYVGAVAITGGVIAEALFSRCMIRNVLRELYAENLPADHNNLTYADITRFYVPLALMGVIATAVFPCIMLFMGRAKLPLESIAIFPLVNGIAFIFKSMGLASQEVIIARLGKQHEGYYPLRRFVALLGVVMTFILGVIAFTTLCDVWYQTVTGLDAELAMLARIPTQVIVLLPAVSLCLIWERAILVQTKNTKPISYACLVELCVVVAIMYWLTQHQNVFGATAGAWALLIGRAASSLFLIRPFLRIRAGIQRDSESG